MIITISRLALIAARAEILNIVATDSWFGTLKPTANFAKS